MPFSNELGMRVYDPTEGENYGLRQGQMFANAYENAQRRAMDERRLKMLEQEQQMKASQLLMQGQGMAELREEVEKGTPFQDAFFKAAPKLFMHNPQALGQIMDAKARTDATKAYRDSLLSQKTKAEQDLQDYREKQLLKPPTSVAESQWEGKLKAQKDVLQTLVESNPNRIDLRQMLKETEGSLESLQKKKSSVSAEPQTITVGGKELIYSPKTGHFEDLSKPEKLSKTEEVYLNAKLAELKSANNDLTNWRKKNVISDIKNPPQEYMVLVNRQRRLEKEVAELTGKSAKTKTISEPAQPGDSAGDNTEEQGVKSIGGFKVRVIK